MCISPPAWYAGKIQPDLRKTLQINNCMNHYLCINYTYYLVEFAGDFLNSIQISTDRTFFINS